MLNKVKGDMEINLNQAMNELNKLKEDLEKKNSKENEINEQIEGQLKNFNLIDSKVPGFRFPKFEDLIKERSKLNSIIVDMIDHLEANGKKINDLLLTKEGDFFDS